MIKNLPAMWETPVQSLGQEDPLEKGIFFVCRCSRRRLSRGKHCSEGHQVPVCLKEGSRLPRSSQGAVSSQEQNGVDMATWAADEVGSVTRVWIVPDSHDFLTQAILSLPGVGSSLACD